MQYFYYGLSFLFGVGITCIFAVSALRSAQARYIKLLEDYYDKVEECHKLGAKPKIEED